RAEIYRSRGLNREALADLDALLAADPEYDPNDYYWRGLLKVELGDYAGARADFSAALRLNPDHAEALAALHALPQPVRGVEPLPQANGAR
ncbi:MAG TPA: tetratricopeptide repeat protein, partial [Geobacteraceae bacterium]|nr:tetratricopeptide repeat protein [Geobacteraceae bacterium]